ncbi:MAG TPA: two-component regulator propeller domain-containing protein, partial [Flavobacterium sp.]|nr:two-component regulator propeller domain-containing protein [Flavobacterium sp.]
MLTRKKFSLRNFNYLFVCGIIVHLLSSCSENSPSPENSVVPLVFANNENHESISDTAGTNLAMGYTMHRFTASDGLMDNNVLALTQDSSGYLWICNGQGLSRYDGSSFSNLRPEREYHPMTSVGSFGGIKLTALPNGEICYQTDKGIVSILNENFSVNRADGFVSCIGKLHGLGAYVFRNGHVDRWSNVWYNESCSKMLYCLHPHGSDSIVLSKDKKQDVFPYFIDVTGNFWIQDSAGLYRFNGSSFDSINLITTTNFYHAYEDRQQNLWLISENDDLYCYTAAGQMEVISLSNEDGEYEGAINEDESGNVYIAFERGIRVYDNHLKETSFLGIKKTHHILKSKGILAFIADSSFSVLVGDNLISEIGKGKISGYVNDELIDLEGNIWLGTTSGLYRFSPSSATEIKINNANVAAFFNQEESYNKQRKFWRDMHTVRLIDTKGRVWFDCFLGLVMFDPKDKQIPYRQFGDINKYVLEMRQGHYQRGWGTERNGFYLIEDKDSAIWIAYDGYLNSALSNIHSDDVYKGGLWRYDNNDGAKRIKANCGTNGIREGFAVQKISIGSQG